MVIRALTPSTGKHLQEMAPDAWGVLRGATRNGQIKNGRTKNWRKPNWWTLRHQNVKTWSMTNIWVIRNVNLGGPALQRGSIFASHPAAPGLILGIPKKLFQCCWELSTALVGGKWTEAWKCWLNPSSTTKREMSIFCYVCQVLVWQILLPSFSFGKFYFGRFS